MHSKIEPERQDHSRVSPASIEYVGCEVHPLAGKADQESTLNVEVGVVCLCTLRYQTRATPIQGGIAQFHPAVEEIASVVLRIEDIFTFRGEFNPPPSE